MLSHASAWHGGEEAEAGEEGRGKGEAVALRPGYVGVCWHKAVQKWQAQITVAGVQQHLGYFDDEADGARAYGMTLQGRAEPPQPWNFPDDSGAKQAKKGDEHRDNISAIPDKGKSRFLGVCWDKQHKKWQVQTGVRTCHSHVV